MKPIYLVVFMTMLTWHSHAQEPMYIQILDDDARRFFDEDTPIQVIGSDFIWTEGPLYIDDGDYLLLSDIPQNTIFKINQSGEVSHYLNPSGFLGQNFQGDEPGSNGLLLDKKGRLILMQHGERRVAYMDAPLDAPQPRFGVLVDKYQGHRLNSPNDGVFDQKGNLYFTDPIYGLPQRAQDPARQLDFCGVYKLSPNGKIELIDTLSRPNGIGLSPMGDKIYVAVSDPNHAVWYEYTINRRGKVRNKSLFYDATHLIGQPGQQGLPDGVTIHSSGYVFASGPGGLWVFNTLATPVARIYTGKATSNCTFSSDEKRLFITADDLVLKIDLK